VQEVCNALFDALFFILPLSTMMDKADATPARLLEAVLWEDDARSELDRMVDKEPVLVRISAAKRLRDAAERATRDAGQKLVTIDRLRVAARLYEAQSA
jgi:3,8-divinyl chlorophyllide a/chlorophyllide a reductase subunit Z